MKIVCARRIVILSAAGAALALSAMGGLVSGQTTQPAHDSHKVSAGGSSVEATARTRLAAAAERTCKILHDMETGAPRGHRGVEHTYLWSKRRMEAQIDVEHTKPDGGDGGIVGIERHLEWMRAWAKQVAAANAKGAYSTFDVASTEFYVAEAEDLLARAKTK